MSKAFRASEKEYFNLVKKVFEKEGIRAIHASEFIKEYGIYQFGKRTQDAFAKLVKELERKQDAMWQDRMNTMKELRKKYPKATKVCSMPVSEICGSRAADSSGSFCGGSNCGWCHNTVMVYDKSADEKYLGCVCLDPEDMHDEIQELIDDREMCNIANGLVDTSPMADIEVDENKFNEWVDEE